MNVIRPFFLGCVLGSTAFAAPDFEKPTGDHGHRAQSGANAFNVAVPAHDCDLILARPEKTSVTLSALAYRDMEGFVSYGTTAAACTNQTPMRQLKVGVPVEFVVSLLQPDAKCFYRFHSRRVGGTPFTDSPEFSFHTARSAGSTFTFTMTADAHLDEHTSAAVYGQSLANVRADAPDFHVDLGNLFMTDKHATRDKAARQYLAQRFYLGQIGAPLFLALGVHDGEGSRSIRIAIRCVPVAATTTAGRGRSDASNTTGWQKRSRTANQNTNSSSSTTCWPATRPRAAAWRSPGSTNGAEEIWMVQTASHNIVPAGRCRFTSFWCKTASRRFSGRTTIFTRGRNSTASCI